MQSEKNPHEGGQSPFWGEPPSWAGFPYWIGAVTALRKSAVKS